MKKFNLIDNVTGWVVFAIAAITYLLTIEPTASFWDCPEFVAQGFKSEIGHPPGNPVFILAARFAACFAGGDVTLVARCVNAMSAIFSALTILLLFWTITHLVRKLVVEAGKEAEMTLTQYLVVMGSGVAGALAYTWSDTFWYSAVEAEVYAFSSFCTALVFWLILKWEDQADDPSSDRWLLLIAYVFGVSLGVHLLNLLCIPAIALIFYYRKWSETSAKGSLITLLVSFVVIVLILYGLEPGFVELAQYFDLFFVNTLGLPFNTGVLCYAVLLVAVLAWGLWELHRDRSAVMIKVSFAAGIVLSGMLFIGDNLLIPVALTLALLIYLFQICDRVPRRLLANITASILVIFIGFASYALILIRSNANTPLDENSPNNTFALAKYLSREQYGETPLLYGRTVYSDIVYQETDQGTYKPVVHEGRTLYSEEVKQSPDDPDRYIATGHKVDYMFVPEQNMIFPRIHSDSHRTQYEQWLGMEGREVKATTRLDRNGNPEPEELKRKPTQLENLRFFIDYQLNYMYWRYFMWNFAGRQNDIQGMGEVNQGNWISGIPFIDNLRLGDQSMLPDDMGKGNKGHNVFYLLPLLLGIIGLLWQSFKGHRGIEQFWVVFFLFFMTGIAIVMYLNQTPSQPRERDYAYAGSFYAFAIWIGMGVAGLWELLQRMTKQGTGRTQLATASVAALLGLAVPLQMVSQTWDDHDRSGRYAARDFGMNYLSSVDKNGIIFTNGDNDTFPLWYCQEVEGYRTDVRVCNLSYLSTDWYIAQMQRAAYESAPLPMHASNTTFAYDNRQYNYFITPDTSMMVPVDKMLEHLYSKENVNNPYEMSEVRYPRVFMAVDADAAIKAGVVGEGDRDRIQEVIATNLLQQGSGLTSSQVMSLDIIASSIEQGWKRPCYFAMTVPQSYYLGLTPYLRNTGMAYQVSPIREMAGNGDIASSTDKMYDIVTTKFRWGGIDVADPGSLYLDETIRRMVTTTRSSLANLASALLDEAAAARSARDNGQATFMGRPVDEFFNDRLDKARTILDLTLEKLPAKASPLALQMGDLIASTWADLGDMSGNKADTEKAIKLYEDEVMRYAGYVRYYQHLEPRFYNRLTNQDYYIEQRYFPMLVMRYVELDEEGAERLVKRVADMGVNLDRVYSYMQYMSGETDK